MTLNKLHETILLGIARDLTRWEVYFAEEDLREIGRDVAFRMDRTDAKAGFVRLDLPAWIGRAPTPSDRTQASRAYRALADAGFIITKGTGWSDRITHVGLSDAGKAIVDELICSQPPCAQHATGPSLVAPEADLKNPSTRGEG